MQLLLGGRNKKENHKLFPTIIKKKKKTHKKLVVNVVEKCIIKVCKYIHVSM